jgi:hypothetical protein
MDYYTYAYLREDGTPYYIGKGKNKRLYNKGNRIFSPPKDKSRILFLKQNLTEEEAFKHEIYMIAVFGRKDLGAGILHNRTNGGEGLSGWVASEETRKKMGEAQKGKTLSEETKAKMSAAHKGKTLSDEHIQKLKNREFSEETIRKMSEAKSGKLKTEETRKKLSEALKGRIFSEEHKRKIINQLNKKRWKCLETGFITNAGALSRYQRARGIDTLKRIKLDI